MKSLKIALIGYGRMGRMIHEVAQQRGHEVVLTIDSEQDTAWDQLSPENVDVAIEFTMPEMAAANVRRLLGLGIAVISGTTGWADALDEVRQELETNKRGSLLWASNFSIGVNLFLAINQEVARMMAQISGYDLSMQEVHHIHKLDAPSGTAITLAERVIAGMPDKLNGWILHENTEPIPEGKLPITSIREGEVPGIHSLRYLSPYDCIELKHEAFSRAGFAQGAVIAAEFLTGRQGFYTMQDLLNYFLTEQH